MEPFYIKVLGEIKTEDDTPQYALNWVCGSIGGDVKNPNFVYNEKEHSHSIYYHYLFQHYHLNSKHL